jgi:hypothetical protein
MPEFAQVGDYCPNEVCADYGKRQNERQNNVVKFGKTKAGRQRYQCKICGNTFTETKGTLFYRRRTPEAEIIETLALLAEGSRISSLTRVKGHKVCEVSIGVHSMTCVSPMLLPEPCVLGYQHTALHRP